MIAFIIMISCQIFSINVYLYLVFLERHGEVNAAQTQSSSQQVGYWAKLTKLWIKGELTLDCKLLNCRTLVNIWKRIKYKAVQLIINLDCQLGQLYFGLRFI